MRSCIARPSRNHTCGSRAPGKVVGTYDMKLCSVAVADLGADHFARLVLLDVGHARELRACCHAGGSPLVDLGPIQFAPDPASVGCEAGCRDVALPDLPALD